MEPLFGEIINWVHEKLEDNLSRGLTFAGRQLTTRRRSRKFFLQMAYVICGFQ